MEEGVEEEEEVREGGGEKGEVKKGDGLEPAIEEGKEVTAVEAVSPSTGQRL